MLEPGVKGGSSVKIGRLADKIIGELMIKLETWSFDFQACALLVKKKKKKVPNALDQQIDLKLIVLRIAKGVCVMNWETGNDVYALLCIKQKTSENRLHSAGNSS